MADDPFAGYVDSGPAAAPAAPQKGSDLFAGFTDLGPNSPPRASVSATRSALAGMLDTASAGFWDEFYGASEASGLPGWLGGLRAPIGAARLGIEKLRGDKSLTNLVTGDTRGPVERKYDEARDLVRKIRSQAEEDNPRSFMAGQVGGALATPGLAATKGATVGARALRAATAGAVQGGLYGVGSGETPAERAIGGVAGAAVGGATGGVASPLVDLAGFGIQKAGNLGLSIYNTVRAELNPDKGRRIVEDEASKRIVASQLADRESQGHAWTPEEVQAANQAGIPRTIGDVGGERTLALARSAANQSPEARAALDTLAKDRFAGQSKRAGDFIKGLTGGADAAGDLEAIRERARVINRPRYNLAYMAGDRPIWSPELERLSASPAIQRAMGSAITSGKDRRIAFGRNPQTGGTTYPNIQYWDYVQRDLKDMAEKIAGREPDKAMFLNKLHQQLNGELDKLVPTFQTARQGAWKSFQAEDALEAGRNFVTARGQNGDYAQILAKIAKENPADKELFARGFASEMADRVLELKDGANVIKEVFLTSPAAKQRIAMALGPDRAKQLEIYLRAESLSDRLRTALGNSSTARQLAEMGLAGAGTLALGHGAIEGEWDAKHALTAALLFGAAYGKHRSQVLDNSVARRIGEMLASDDPAILRRGVQAVANSRAWTNALRTAGDRIGASLSGRIAPSQAAGVVVPKGGTQ